MKHLRKLNRIFQVITYLPRGNICLKNNIKNLIKDDKDSSDKEVAEH